MRTQPATIIPPLQEQLSQHFLDTRIRQQLVIEKAETPLRKGIFYLLGFETRAEPGYLFFQEGKEAIFLSGRQNEVQSLRLRFNKTIAEKGSVLIATLDKHLSTLQLEDIWLDCGEVVRSRSFAERWKRLQTFTENNLIQDKKLSGLDIHFASFRPLEDLKDMVESHDFKGIDFIPEQGDRRRFFLPLGGGGGGGGGSTRADRPDTVRKNLNSLSTEEATPPPLGLGGAFANTNGSLTFAWAQKVVGMPDTYELFDLPRGGKHLGRAAVQNLSRSLELRKQTAPRFPVEVAWHSDFLCYEIVGLQQNGA